MTDPQRASLSTKFFYGSGATAFGIKDTAFNYFLLAYYNQVLGLNAFLTGLALALAIVIDATSDLAVGYVSDHWRSRWGRRHPFMYAATVPVAVTFVFLWNPPAFVLNGELSLFLYLLGMAVLVRTCLTFFEIPNASLGPELSKDYHDRTGLMAFRYLFGWLGGLCVAVLAYMVLFNLDPKQQLGPTGYRWVGVVGACAMLVMMFVSSLGTHRHIKTLYVPVRQKTHSLGKVFGQFQGLFQNRSFLSVFFASLCFGAAAGMSQALSVYLGTFFWMLKSTEIGYIPLLGLVAVPVSFFFAPRMSRRWGKRRAARFAYLFAIGFLPIAFVAQLTGWFPPRSSDVYLPLLMLNYLVETTAIIVMQIIFSSMNADVVEERSAETAGRRNEGLIFATRNFSNKAVSGLGLLLAGSLLWLVGFPSGAQAGQVSQTVVDNLILIYLPTLIVLYLTSWYILRFYAIDEARHTANLQAASVSEGVPVRAGT